MSFFRRVALHSFVAGFARGQYLPLSLYRYTIRLIIMQQGQQGNSSWKKKGKKRAVSHQKRTNERTRRGGLLVLSRPGMKSFSLSVASLAAAAQQPKTTKINWSHARIFLPRLSLSLVLLILLYDATIYCSRRIIYTSPAGIPLYNSDGDINNLPYLPCYSLVYDDLISIHAPLAHASWRNP